MADSMFATACASAKVMKLNIDSYKMYRKMISEGKKRLKLLGVKPYVIDRFNQGILYHSAGHSSMHPVFGELASVIRDFEKQNNVMVYHVISYRDDHRKIACLYINTDVDDWSNQREDLSCNCPAVYMKDMDNGSSDLVFVDLEYSNGVLKVTDVVE